MARNCRAAFAAADIGAHGLGDRKELSASHKQDSSCTHDTQDLEGALSGMKPSDDHCNSRHASDPLMMSHNTDTDVSDKHLKASLASLRDISQPLMMMVLSSGLDSPNKFLGEV